MRTIVNWITVIFMVFVVITSWTMETFSDDRRVDIIIFDIIGIILISMYYTFVDKTSPFYYKGLLEDE